MIESYVEAVKGVIRNRIHQKFDAGTLKDIQEDLGLRLNESFLNVQIVQDSLAIVFRDEYRNLQRLWVRINEFGQE